METNRLQVSFTVWDRFHNFKIHNIKYKHTNKCKQNTIINIFFSSSPPLPPPSFASLLLLTLLFDQPSLSSPLHTEHGHSTTHYQTGEGGTGQQEVLLTELPDQGGPSPQEVMEQCFLLGQRAEGQQDVEELVTVTNDVKATRWETLRYGTGEEEGCQQKQHHLLVRKKIRTKNFRSEYLNSFVLSIFVLLRSCKTRNNVSINMLKLV